MSSSKSLITKQQQDQQDQQQQQALNSFSTWLQVEKNLEEQYMRVQEKSLAFIRNKKQRCGVGEKAVQNIVVSPYEDNRVMLKKLSDDTEEDSTFINASYLDGRKYIATVMPQNDVMRAEIWRMIYEQKVELIVMLNRDGEHHTIPYWPKDLNVPTRYDHYIVILKQKRYYFGDTIVRTFVIKPVSYLIVNSNPVLSQSESDADILVEEFSERMVTHIQYTDWADILVPEYKDGFIDFVNFLIGLQQQQNWRAKKKQMETPPLVVHCYGGIGRTGTLLLILEALVKNGFIAKPSKGCPREMIEDPSSFKKDPSLILTPDDPLGLAGILLRMRSERAHMVQTPEQYKFAHWVVVEMINSNNANSQTSSENNTSEQRRRTKTVFTVQAFTEAYILDLEGSVLETSTPVVARSRRQTMFSPKTL